MGTDFHTGAQKRNRDGSWADIRGGFARGSDPFDWRSYSLLGFLAGVRNSSAVTPISQPRGLPQDFGRSALEDAFRPDEQRWLGDHNFTWLSIEELAAVDYDQVSKIAGFGARSHPMSGRQA